MYIIMYIYISIYRQYKGRQHNEANYLKTLKFINCNMYVLNAVQQQLNSYAKKSK